jgi:Zn-finger nucleic acid-binding protein
MKCPACKRTLREKNTGEVVVDMCYGGCGGLWFDAAELQRVTPRAAATLHTIWQPPHRTKPADEPRVCPRCPGQRLDRKWFSEAREVEIDQCPQCQGIWLDDGEFTGIREEILRGGVASPPWAPALANAVSYAQANPGPRGGPTGT